ncbi:glycosyltransferase family 2 protein [Candidatus Woesearchaeota archaeon]|nr:glycosyltransferase family 2 protein [Candidatus Woesearchaeota archaeon]
MIFEIYIWVLSFISVFVALLWVIVNYTSKNYKIDNIKLKDLPFVTVAVPVWNEEDTIIPTLNSILHQNYPKDKIEIIVVDDKSSDSTFDVVKKFIKNGNYSNINLIRHKLNLGKAGALNTALKIARGGFFWVYDADSISSRNLLKNMITRFFEQGNSDVAAVVAITLIKNKGNWIAKMQRLEYIMAAFVRKLLGSVDTLHITNALSLFRTKVIRNLGGYDTGNLTEDLEIALKLRYNGYRIVMCENGNFHTNVPETMRKMWMQRVRWFRGFIHNNIKYRKFIFNKNFGLLGLFQIPIEVFFLLIVFISVIVFSYHFLDILIDFIFEIYIKRFGIFDFTYPGIQQLILNTNFKLLFPSTVVLILGLYLYLSAHDYVGEKWRFYIPSLLYLFVYPIFRSMQWVHALVLELFRAERKW